jgi:hypothetical protein
LNRTMLAAFAASAFAATLAAPAGANEVRDYPIHYDGPMVHHAQPFMRSMDDTLPNFNVTFHGGPVQTTTTSYSIYWRPKGYHMSKTYAPLIDRFLADAGGSPIYGMATIYSGSNGPVQNVSTFGDSWTDTTPYPSRGIRDSDIQAEVAKAMKANGWPPGITSAFFVMTGKDALPTVQYCAYHSAFNYKGNKQKPVAYGFVPYVGYVNGCDPPYGITPNNDIAADGSIISLSHEQEEMVTDPLLNAWYDDVNGEIGDICIFAYGVPYGRGGANMVINNHPYFLQEDWSQTAMACQPNL